MARADGRALQEAYARFRRTGSGRHLEPVWSSMALHRPAEFNKSHVPAFLAEEEPRAYVCVYPFVRSYEWYLLPEAERRALLAEHGQLAREYPDVRANTVASFALGDYEWMLAFEADELHRIVDLMRHLRVVRDARHVRAEVPFFTGAPPRSWPISSAPCRSGFFLERQRDRVDAVAQVGRCAVALALEDVPEMAVARWRRALRCGASPCCCLPAR